MAMALELAERGRGYVEPNPLVGAVVVRDGEVVGRGWHQKFGAAHAEINALGEASEQARGATLYVTLEPCCHQGKTPPCTDAVIEAKIARVVAAMADPFAQVAGKGAARLREAEIDVTIGVGESEARRLNAPYLKLLDTGRPYVHAKWAMTLDGKICTHTGDSKWISGEASRQRVHALRGRMDAILVGIGTVMSDDPQLTARPQGPRTATRIVLDSNARLPMGSLLTTTARQFPTLIAVSQRPACDITAIEQAGCEVVRLPTGEHGRLDVEFLLDELGKRRMTNLLVEGGSAVLGSFVDADAIDEYHIYISPRIVGGEEAKSPVAGSGVDMIAKALKLAAVQVETIESDIYLRGRRLLHSSSVK